MMYAPYSMSVSNKAGPKATQQTGTEILKNSSFKSSQQSGSNATPNYNDYYPRMESRGTVSRNGHRKQIVSNAGDKHMDINHRGSMDG